MFILVFVLVDKSLACRCMPSFSVEVSFEESSAVFSGEVIKKVQTPAYEYEVTFRILENYKGIKERKVLVYTGLDAATCGYAFEEGVKYLVYANRMNNKFYTNICTRTRPLSDAKEDLAILKENKKKK